MARLTSCILHCAVTLQIQALKRSQISILVVNRPLKPLGRYLTPGEPNHTLNHSCCVVPHEYFISWGIYGKTSRICFLQSSSFRMPSTLTMLHSFHYWIAIGFGSPHHYYPCLSVWVFRLRLHHALYPVYLQIDNAQWSISSRTACGLTDRCGISPFRH